MDNNVEKRIKNVMASILDVNESVINNDTSSENLEKWDSILHMHLILALEDEFGIEFLDDEISELLNFSSLYDSIQKKVYESKDIS